MVVEVNQKQLSEEEFLVKVKDLPAFNELKMKVDKIVQQSTWWQRYGIDNAHFLFAIILYIFGMSLLAHQHTGPMILGILSMGLGHSIIAAKVFHAATHGSMGQSQWYNSFVCWLTGDFLNLFPTDGGIDTHIKGHHPHTNIVGKGDSSIWKVPLLPRTIYLFIAPILLPAVTPLIGLQLVWHKPWWRILWYVVSATLGLTLCCFSLHSWTTHSYLACILLMLASRAVFTVSYIHINIFQHVGLPMYSHKNRPARLYQMSSGVLNLRRNPILDLAFGHSLISCHVEHHLFPTLSDNMCLTIQPIVKEFLLKHGLPYNEDYYYNRLKIFFRNYPELMVNAPPIWHYAGLQ